jgi:hypothetical protein
VQNLKRIYLNQTELELYRNSNFKDFSGWQKGLFVEEGMLFRKAYQDQLARIVGILDEKVGDLRKRRFAVTQQDHDLIVGALSECPVHIGHGAESANEPLTQLIREGTFGLDLQSRTVTAHLEKLQQFEFPMGTYEALEARVRANRKSIARGRQGRP